MDVVVRSKSQRLRHRGGMLAAVLTVLMMLGLATKADAYSADYCGRLIASSYNSNCFGPYASITYNSARYTGGGTIDNLQVTHGGQATTAFGATFVSICSNYYITETPGLSQYDGGASHTIYGHVDNSLNHSGCYV